MSIPLPRNILCSFHYFRNYDLDQYANLHIVGDSGAFSAESQGAKISTADLAGWAKQWRHRLVWVAALDVIGNPEATRRNWHDMVENHGIPGVPTIHFGANPKELGYFAARGVDFVGLGGMVGKHTAKQMRWLITVFRYARDHHPDMRFHGWGVTSDRVLQLPFYSVDSSGWTQAFRFDAIASAAAFLVAESLDFAVYVPIRKRAKFGDKRWALAVVASNIVGAIADTVVFLGIAFGSAAILPALPGQFVGKLYATVVYLLIGWAVARLVINRFRKPVAT